MFTQCPECKKSHHLTVEELRSSRGVIHCTACSAQFDALQQLSATPFDDTDVPPLPKSMVWNNEQKPVASSVWRLALTAMLVLFVMQVYYFEGYSLTQNESVRPWLKKACTFLDCQLTAYRNLEDFNILHSSFEAQSETHFVFQSVINNQANFPQQYPEIMLTLFDFNGQLFAQRIFFAKDYLTQPNTAAFIQADEVFTINLSIAAPDTRVGGFEFKII